jgi:hypothetical protein
MRSECALNCPDHEAQWPRIAADDAVGQFHNDRQHPSGTRVPLPRGSRYSRSQRAWWPPLPLFRARPLTALSGGIQRVPGALADLRRLTLGDWAGVDGIMISRHSWRINAVSPRTQRCGNQDEEITHQWQFVGQIEHYLPLHIVHGTEVSVSRPDRLRIDINGDNGAALEH